MASAEPMPQASSEPLAHVRAAALRGNPLRADISWQLLSIEAIAAIAVGLYAFLDESGALRNAVTLIGIYLLLDGLSCAIGEVTSSEPASTQDKFRLIRSGIGIATGVIAISERIYDFMDLTPTRVVVGLGLLGIGLVTVFGAVAGREESRLRLSGIGIALLLAAWGIIVLYQANSDSNSMGLFGTTAIIAGVGLAALAYLRWRRTTRTGDQRTPITR